MIYLDNASTTMVDPKVLEAMLPFFTRDYANPASIHSMGEEAGNAVEKSRDIIARSISADPSEIYFTSGGTESNNLALHSFDKIVTTEIEHPSVLNLAKLKNAKLVNVDNEGYVDIADLENKIKGHQILSVIHANNEIGTIQNIAEIGKLCRDNCVFLHVDACQSYTKLKIDVNDVDLLTLNSHKIHGPKGVGALYVKQGLAIKPLFYGGNQQKFRSGTLNVHGIVGFGKAVELANESHVDSMRKLIAQLTKGVLEIPEVQLNGPHDLKQRLCNNANFSFNAIEGEAIGGRLSLQGIMTSTGSACSSRKLETSHVLRAIGLSHELCNGSLRMSVSRFNTKDEIDKVNEVLPEVVSALREISQFWKSC